MTWSGYNPLSTQGHIATFHFFIAWLTGRWTLPIRLSTKLILYFVSTHTDRIVSQASMAERKSPHLEYTACNPYNGDAENKRGSDNVYDKIHTLLRQLD